MFPPLALDSLHLIKCFMAFDNEVSSLFTWERNIKSYDFSPMRLLNLTSVV